MEMDRRRREKQKGKGKTSEQKLDRGSFVISICELGKECFRRDYSKLVGLSSNESSVKAILTATTTANTKTETETETSLVMLTNHECSLSLFLHRFRLIRFAVAAFSVII